MRVVFLYDKIEDNQLMLYYNIDEKCKIIYKKFKYKNCTLDSFVNLIKFYNFIKLINDRVTLEYFDEEIFACNIDELKEKIIEFKKKIENED